MQGRMNKHKAVRQWLESHAGISSMEAIDNFGATRLSAIIYNLRHKHGLNIETVWCEGKDRFGNPMRFARYYLRNSPSQDGGIEL